MKAFTLIEVLLVIAIIGILFAFSVQVFGGFQNRNDLDIAVNTVAQSYRRAAFLAQAVDGDSSWGVKVQNGQITIFKGSSYNNREQNYDEDFNLPASITPSGMDEVVFSTFTGFPQTVGVLTLHSVNNETKTISLNEKGIVNY